MAKTPDDPAIALQGISRGFTLDKQHVQALDNIHLEIKPGIVTGLIGPDGAGKTTLMRLCAGLLRPDSGTVKILGIDVQKHTLSVQKRLGYMPQRFGLYEDLTVQENMDLYADLQGVPTGQRKGRFSELLHMAGMSPFTTRLAGNLSGGMKQKLGLVCTLVSEPRVLLLDEPTVGVDPISRRELWEIVYRLVETTGMSVLLSTAYLDEAERCTEVILIHKGRVLGHGPPGQFSRSMQGRSWKVTGFRPEERRRLQAELADHPHIIDALILGNTIRIITDRDAIITHPILRQWPNLRTEPASPRFEDCFIARIRELSEHDEVREIRLRHRIKVEPGREIIKVRDLKRKFGSFYAVNGINFSVRQGEVFGLLGANGAGKTTTFRMLCGLLPISEGKCLVAGKDLRSAAPSARAHIGYMAQKFSLYSELSVIQNLDFFSRVYGLRGQHRQKQVQWALDTFELHPYSDTRAGTLPLGFKQRLALAASLMHEPEILFLDEPTSGVDPLARREFWRHINNLVRQGVTVLVTTHFMEEAEYCDRLVIMAEGKVLAEGTPEELKERCAAGRADIAEIHDETGVTMEDAFIFLLEHQQGEEIWQ